MTNLQQNIFKQLILKAKFVSNPEDETFIRFEKSDVQFEVDFYFENEEISVNVFGVKGKNGWDELEPTSEHLQLMKEKAIEALDEIRKPRDIRFSSNDEELGIYKPF